MNTKYTKKTRASFNRRLAAAHPYVFVSYESSVGFGFVAVINAEEDQLVTRIPVGLNPGPMALDLAEEKLFVVNKGGGSVSIINTTTLRPIGTVSVGTPNMNYPDPVAILSSPNGEKFYVANAGHKNVSIIHSHTNKVIKNVDVGPGRPFAFVNNEDSNYVFVACKLGDKKDYVLAISIKDDSVHPCYEGVELTFDGIHNPMAISYAPESFTQVVLGKEGALCFVGGDVIGKPGTFSFLDDTVSGLFVINEDSVGGFLFCTTPFDKNILKRFDGLYVDKEGGPSFERYSDSLSYKGQDIIRASRTQEYIGITLQPSASLQGGLQIYNSTGTDSLLVQLDYVGDLTFYEDTKAYVGELQSIRPIDLASGTALPAIDIGGTNNRITVKNLISGFRSQS